MNKSIVFTAIVMLVAGLAVGYWIASESPNAMPASSVAATEPLFYRNPMNPTVISPVPAKDSMGMDYIAVYADDDDGNSDSAGTVKIDAVVSQNIGVRTAIATRSSISREIRAVARVDFDERSMARLHPKVEGWIEELRIDTTGENVVRNEVLLSIYSPKLVSTQREYLLALTNREALKNSPFDEIQRGAEELVESARERLLLFDVPAQQIRELEKTREIQKNLHIQTPVAGTVISIGARQGQFVTPKTELYMIVELSTVWVYADIYEYELPWVKVGDKVKMSLAGIPGRTFYGELDYIYPYAEARSRSVKVRLAFDNPELLLKPEMFAEVVIQSDRQVDAIVIPSEAVIRSGKLERVFVVRAPGKFEPVIVSLGVQSGGRVAVLEGLQEGDEVVVSGQFLLDSESSLREATVKMMQLEDAEQDGESASDMEGMDMGDNSAGAHE